MDFFLPQLTFSGSRFWFIAACMFIGTQDSGELVWGMCSSRFNSRTVAKHFRVVVESKAY